MYCQRLKMHAFNADKGLLVRLRCKTWGCDYCSEINKIQWRSHLKNKLPQIGTTWSFVTITATGNDHENHMTFKAIQSNWERLIKRLKRAWGAFEYVRVYERHKSGEYHAHALISYYPSDGDPDNKSWETVWRKNKKGVWAQKKVYRGSAYTELQNSAVGVKLGVMVDFTPLYVKDKTNTHAINAVADYITKYMGKSLQDVGHGVRRVTCSSRIGNLKPRGVGDDVWLLRSFIYIEDVAKWGVISDLTRKVLVSFDQFEYSSVYPLMNDKY